MITITPQAAAQIRKAAEQADAEDMYLRLAAKRADDGNIEYAMGFDDMGGQDRHGRPQEQLSERRRFAGSHIGYRAEFLLHLLPSRRLASQIVTPEQHGSIS